MARVSGVDIPENKQVRISLRYIYGIGPTNAMEILQRVNVNPMKRVFELSDDELNAIRDLIDKQYVVEGGLRKQVQLDIKRLIDIGSYRGLRHKRGLPVHGQRTKTNARTRKGVKKTVAGRGKATKK
ncbi:MAG: 30S ribosomal protein S13 [Chloroflexi bacterium]|nr:30S ribosomal protein S13 [Chloroflexota bacterium]